MPNNPIETPKVTPPPTEESAGTPAPPEDLSQSESGVYVQFTQLANDPLKGSHRVIYKTEWTEAGIADQGDVTFGPINGYRVPVESLTDEAVKRLLKEPGFAKVKVDKDGKVEPPKEDIIPGSDKR